MFGIVRFIGELQFRKAAGLMQVTEFGMVRFGRVRFRVCTSLSVLEMQP